MLKDYKNVDVRGIFVASQSAQRRYLEITDFDIFKNAKSLPGTGNVFGISQTVKKQVGSRFLRQYSPGEPCLGRCNDCTQKKIRRVGCVNCSKAKDAFVIHFKNKAYLWLKLRNAGGLSYFFCRYA